MENQWWIRTFGIVLVALMLDGCASYKSLDQQIATGDYNGDVPLYRGQAPYSSAYNEKDYYSRLPQNINIGKEKIILVDPSKFAWGAYDENGQLIRAGIAIAGDDYCADVKRPCRTAVGKFRLTSLGGPDCVSKKYPIPTGGSFMPYCMFFHNGQSIHGAPDQMMQVEDHVSHGCVRIRIPDAAWLRYNFAAIGTRVIILPY